MISDIEFVNALIERMPINPPMALISDYAEAHRVLPVNTPFPGPWKNSLTPYLVEPMNNMAPGSGVEHTVFMSGAQVGKSSLAENVVAYYMGECPADMLVVLATDDLLGRWLKRLEPLIDSCGIRPKLIPIATNSGSRRTGDTRREKQYIGGTLNMASAQSPSSLRAETKRVLIRDEIDGAPEQLRTGEGSWVDVSAVRTTAFGSRKKILDLSTPSTIEKTVIYPLYEDGDQRFYMVPCPLCKKYQYLQFGNEQSNYGLKADTENGVITSAYYLCDYCHDAIVNYDKTEMMAKGRWEPSVSGHRDIRSYHLPSLYSPVGMLTWLTLAKEREKAEETPDGMRNFVMTRQGWPYKESGSRPDIQNVLLLRGAYKEREIQLGILFLTAFVDVQSGSKKDKKNPPRLEMEVCGFGAGYRSWSVLYKRFEGPIDDPYAGAWEDMNQWAIDGGLNFTRKDGQVFQPQLICIDSGDGNYKDIVYRFTERWQKTSPSKGFNTIKQRKNEKAGDEFGTSNDKRFKLKPIGGGNTLVEISTNFYKRHLYSNLKVPRQDMDPQRPGFCDFPRTYKDDYFKMLTAEEQRRDGSFHCPSGRRNEALDNRVGCMCAADVYLDGLLQAERQNAKKRGLSKQKIEQEITLRTIIDGLGMIFNMK